MSRVVSSVSVRRAPESLLPDIKALDKECLPGCQWYPGEYWWGAWCDGELVGYAGLAASRQFRDCGYLCRAGVLPAYRGLGLHRRLIAVRLRHAAKLGWHAVVTDTRKNCASANNLIRSGFVMYEPANPWSFTDACYWKKLLTDTR